jgi:prephenate dehydratase
LRVSLLGPKGTFSEEAALNFFGKEELVYRGDINRIFDDVVSGRTDYGIVPIENSLEGSIGLTLELFLKVDLMIYGEVVIDIRHSLLCLKDSTLDDIKEVISHPHALAQCKGFIGELGLNTKNCLSTAEAAREVSRRKLKNTAAIAPERAAELYGLKVLKSSVQDEDYNQTRFLVIAKHDSARTGKDKTSIIFSLLDKPGALYEALGAFVKGKINLTKIESRPSRKALGDYVFFVDFEGHRSDARVRRALKELENKVSFMKLLGSYPAARRD